MREKALQKSRFESKIRHNMNNRGFTLIELLVTIAIVGILAALATTAYVGVQKKAARSEAYSNLNSIRLLEEQFFAENACYQPLVAGACPAGAATFTGVVAIAAFLPGFKPGPDTGLSFTYSITVNNGVGLPVPVPIPYNGATAALVPATTPCFIVRATGRPNTRVDGDDFAIDCNNNRNIE
jgi:prepilin-type N-terminal cleavage/methylation domain-containing protein